MQNTEIKTAYYDSKRAIWEPLAGKTLTDENIDEIYYNLRAFSKALLNLHKGIEKRKRKGGLLETTCKGRNESNDENDEMR